MDIFVQTAFGTLEEVVSKKVRELGNMNTLKLYVSPEFNEVSRQAEELYQSLQDKMAEYPEIAEAFQAYLDKYVEQWSLEEVGYYRKGLLDGLRMALALDY